MSDTFAEINYLLYSYIVPSFSWLGVITNFVAALVYAKICRSGKSFGDMHIYYLAKSLVDVAFCFTNGVVLLQTCYYTTSSCDSFMNNSVMPYVVGAVVFNYLNAVFILLSEWLLVAACLDRLLELRGIKKPLKKHVLAKVVIGIMCVYFCLFYWFNLAQSVTKKTEEDRNGHVYIIYDYVNSDFKLSNEPLFSTLVLIHVIQQSWLPPIMLILLNGLLLVSVNSYVKQKKTKFAQNAGKIKLTREERMQIRLVLFVMITTFCEILLNFTSALLYTFNYGHDSVVEHVTTLSFNLFGLSFAFYLAIYYCFDKVFRDTLVNMCMYLKSKVMRQPSSQQNPRAVAKR